jgi:hypothetical protein
MKYRSLLLHSCRCIVFECLDSNPGLNSNFCLFELGKVIEIEKKKRVRSPLVNLPSQPSFHHGPARQVRPRPLSFPPRPRVAAQPSRLPAQLARAPRRLRSLTAGAHLSAPTSRHRPVFGSGTGPSPAAARLGVRAARASVPAPSLRPI